MYQTCQEKIEIPNTDGRKCTYCQRPAGHLGSHSVFAFIAEKLKEDKKDEPGKNEDSGSRI